MEKQLLQSESSTGPVSHSPWLLQRKCACGGSGGAHNECEECRNKATTLQRKAARAGANPAVPPIVHEVLRSSGQPLDSQTRAFFEPRFGHDFSRVRVHTDDRAARSAKAINALAYTVGNNVVFGAGQFNPNSRDKRQLLAHELAHAVQQARGLTSTSPGPDHEREADAASESVVQRGHAPRIRMHSPIGIARQADDGGTSAPPDSAIAGPSPELTERDANACSPLYLQKLCVYITGGFNGDRSGVETPEEMARYNQACRDESGYAGADVQLSDREKAALRNPTCIRGERDSARKKARSERIWRALKLSIGYMPEGIGEELVNLITDRLFLTSLLVAIAVYFALWLAPEPVFTKIIAAATTLAILATGAFAVSTILNLARAWMDLDAEAGDAESDEAVQRAAEKFGKRIGRVEADLIVFLASLLLGGKLPGPKQLPPPEEALAGAESSLASVPPGGKVIQGPWGRARATPSSGGEPILRVKGSGALKPEFAPAPEPEVPTPEPETAPAAEPAPAPATAKATQPTKAPMPKIPAVPGVGTAPDEEEKKKRPPFTLWLPRQKEPHLERYRQWLGVLQSDPNYQRGNTPQLERWHQALRIGGSDPIPAEVYERGHQLGFTGEAGERRIRVPDWTRHGSSVAMQVDHIVELQLVPSTMRSREEFDSIFNWELLDAVSNISAGPLLTANIARERAQQEAIDPSLKGQVLRFDAVELDGGTPADRWTPDDLRAGEQLDAYEQFR